MDTGMLPDIAQLSLWQVERALASLSEGEKIALMKIARLYARKTPYDKEDLVQEALRGRGALNAASMQKVIHFISGLPRPGHCWPPSCGR